MPINQLAHAPINQLARKQLEGFSPHANTHLHANDTPSFPPTSSVPPPSAPSSSQEAPERLYLNGALLTTNMDYFASLDASTGMIQSIFNRTWSGSPTLMSVSGRHRTVGPEQHKFRENNKC